MICSKTALIEALLKALFIPGAATSIKTASRFGAMDIRDKMVQTTKGKDPPKDGCAYLYFVLNGIYGRTPLFRLTEIEKTNIDFV